MWIKVISIQRVNSDHASKIIHDKSEKRVKQTTPEEQPKKKMSKGKSVQEQMMNTGTALLKSDEDKDDKDEN